MIKSGAQLVEMIKPNITEVSVETLANNLATDIIVIDVREPAEYAEGHIAGAINMPRGVLEMKLHMHPKVANAEAPLEELNRFELYLICRSGARSALAAESIQRMGFDKVKSVSGGMMAWTEKGYHTEA